MTPAAGIVHRDIKPENLLYTSNDPSSPGYNLIKVTDFGFSRVSHLDAMRTTCGTPEYMAPEMLAGDYSFDGVPGAGYGPGVDLWSLGVVMYVMLSGYFPFLSTSQPSLFRKIVSGDFSFSSEYWSDVSSTAKEFIRQVLVVNPRGRLSAAAALEHPWVTAIACPEEQQNSRLHGSHRAFMLIRQLPLFSDVGPACLQEVVDRLQSVRVEHGQHVMRAGDHGDSMYFINQGRVSVQADGEEIDLLTTGVCVCVCLCVCVC